MTDLSPPDPIPGVPDKTARADKPGWVPHQKLTAKINSQRAEITRNLARNADLKAQRNAARAERDTLLTALQAILAEPDSWIAMEAAMNAVKKAEEGTQHA